MPKALVGITGMILIGVALYFTKNANCLWALILVIGAIEEF